MPAAVEESGSAVIPADLLPDILKRLPGDQVSFSTVGPGIIHIGSGYAEYRLNILDAAKYPLPEVPFLEDTIPVSGIFLSLFHKEDQELAQGWLERTETQDAQ